MSFSRRFKFSPCTLTATSPARIRASSSATGGISSSLASGSGSVLVWLISLVAEETKAKNPHQQKLECTHNNQKGGIVPFKPSSLNMCHENQINPIVGKYPKICSRKFPTFSPDCGTLVIVKGYLRNK